MTGLRVAVVALAAAYGAASVAVALDVDPNFPTTYAAASTVSLVAGLAAGLGLIAAGSLVVLERRAGSVGPLVVSLGVVWLAPDWVGLESAPAGVRSVAELAAPFVPALLLHLVLCLPHGRVDGVAARRLVVAAYAVTGTFALERAALRDPYLDPLCWSNCSDNVFLVHDAGGLAARLGDVWLALCVAGGVAVAALACRRTLRASRPARAALAPILLPAALAAAAQALYAGALLREGAEDPAAAGFRAVFLAAALSLGALAAGVAWTVARRRRTTVALQRLAADLGDAPEPGSLPGVLARTLGDPGLQVAYRLPGSERHVDGEGRPVALPSDGRAITPIVRDGEEIAVVVHDRALATAAGLEREIGAAARLAVDNDRLRAGVLAQLEELRASRVRVVAAGDAARERIERDLHDGAQQRLLALLYELRLARGAAEADGRDDLAVLLGDGAEQVEAVLGHLRDLAHGIHPAILSEAGLGPALWTVVETAPIAVDIVQVPDERLPGGVERAAYLVVTAALEAATTEGAEFAEVAIRRRAGDVLVTVTGCGSAPPAHLADRVGALGGRVGLRDGSCTAEIPCA